MKGITVRSLTRVPEFSSLQLIAGESGLDNPICRCGILDYEYDESLGDKFINTTFEPEQLALTSLMFAKNDEFLIMKAVRNLIDRGCNALAIKNVYKLPIHDSVIRYADSRGFPIFLIKDRRLFFEDIIYTVLEMVRRVRTAEGMQHSTDRLLAGAMDDAGAVRLMRQMNPSFLALLACAYFYAAVPFGEDLSQPLADAFARSGLLRAGDEVYPYKNGMMLVHTCDAFPTTDAAAVMAPFLQVAESCGQSYRIGISSLHYRRAELGDALRESLCAAQLAIGGAYTAYDGLGAFQLLLHGCGEGGQNPGAFHHRIHRLLQDHDAENGTRLAQTAIHFVRQEGDIERTALAMAQHKNTIRYRLDAMGKILGFNVYSRAGYEQLALAVKLQIAMAAENCFGHPPYTWENVLLPPAP